jgi:peptidoglycan/xylan/chitin deacetylase (PgdA/CDA1 family)
MVGFRLTVQLLAGILSFTVFNGCGPASDPSSQVQDFQPRNITRFGLFHSKNLVLSFDDGPSVHTAKLLDMLQERGIKATFFVLGKNARNYRNLLQRMESEGHIVANHTKTHADLGHVSPEVAFGEIEYTHGKIRSFTGTHRLYFRAPYGAWTSAHATLLNANAELKPYIGPIFWNVGGETRFAADGEIIAAADWECWSKHRGIPTCRQGYINEMAAIEGGVVLMHDITENTVEMAGELIDYWLRDGYRFITLDSVRALDQYEAH